MRALIWLREDLRIADNTALYHAARLAANGVIAVYIISPQEWQAHDRAANRVDFILRHLTLLSQDLNRLNIPLLMLTAATTAEVPLLLLQTAQRYQCQKLFYNQQYPIDEARRDMAVDTLLTKHHIPTYSYTDEVILAPGEVLTQSGNYFTVFTPFKKAWLKRLAEEGGVSVMPPPQQQLDIPVSSSNIPQQVIGFQPEIDPSLWPVGEHYAQQQLQMFINQRMQSYHSTRDFPALDATSRLSPYLAAGILSPRQCLKAVLKANMGQLEAGNLGAVIWVNELIWREFYKHVVHGFPQVSMNRPFKHHTERLVWDNNPEKFTAWQAGKTGYPLVDAAMRQLNHEGWMHNRLRMVTAMFLCKDLLIDWRWGEKHFMRHLVDGDLAANNGGWQWAASTGTDAAPYFRLFNPTTQSLRFDPAGDFIKRYCPELASLSTKDIHNPPAGLRAKLNYPSPIVDHNQARLRVKEMFAAIKTL